MSRPRSQEVLVEGLPEVVLGEGEHAFRVIFNPKKFKNCHDIDILVRDTAGDTVDCRLERWGTKMKVEMNISAGNTEGVASVLLRNSGKYDDREIAWFWLVK